ncbi:MAG TPA: adenylate/guanylate cyclase domain-containing protein [Candidatus Dormibacteraeota bacterium]|nr:adenylate/guanylate cyclase domain-containing protein [Candidatus Dormibacteraeota bacterium]
MSVLFVDLVGFTSLAEQRDAEEVRELLTRYFDIARQVIGRYGGTVEKFIGDAVMAVWGAPTAQEDDAERTVRAALDLVAAVAALGSDIGHETLRARAGVVTGEVAVTVGAVGQGMVAGDAVNTASRVQAAAAPGSVLVDDATRRSTELAIAYEDAGRRPLKGKAEDVQLWRAARVVAMVRGGQRGPGLEAPFVGRDHELRLVKELFHATVEEGRARLVSITGMAGIGKSRLAWEFEKYIDGVADLVFWHRGRCLAYGEGVTYWALAEMVRSRAGILEAEPAATVAAKLRACLDERVSDPEERSWLEPRLANLLGLEDHANVDRIDLFAAWRVFFERLAERQPTVLVFEEMQWADSGLVEFVEYLLEWSRHHPLYVLTLSRPEFTDRFPSWGAGKRSFHALYLEPLSPASMDELLTGLVPGLPDELRIRIRERSEGVPLYAVETVRMLLDRGTLKRDGNRYTLSGPVTDLAVPETLHALIAARLDALPGPERDVMQAGAVLGQSFTVARLAALMEGDEESVRPLLDSLVRKELLSVQADPRSPERGQYGFLQALVQKVAYDTLSRRERKTRHLAAARQLEEAWQGETDEIVEVIAAHYLEAYNASPSDDDAGEIRESARRMLVRAGQRAASLGASEEALRDFMRAADLAEDGVQRAGLLESAGLMASRTGDVDQSIPMYEEAIALLGAAGESHAAARITARLGGVMFRRGQPREALERLTASYEVLRHEEPDGDLGSVAHQIARLHFFLGEPADASEPIEAALDIAEAQRLPELLCESLITKALLASHRGHHNEAIALLEYARTVALERELSPQVLRASFNLVHVQGSLDRFDEALRIADEGLTLARRRGDRDMEWMLLSTGIDVLFSLGQWDQALARAAELPPAAELRNNQIVLGNLLSTVYIHAARGDFAPAAEVMAAAEGLKDSADVQERASYSSTSAALLHARRQYADALREASSSIETYVSEPTSLAESIANAGDAALALGDVAAAHALIERVALLGAAKVPERARAHMLALRARLTAQEGDNQAADTAFAAAERVYVDINTPFPLATCRLAHAAALKSAGRDAEAEPLLDAAEAELTRLRARPWLERLAAVRSTRAAEPHARAGIA